MSALFVVPRQASKKKRVASIYAAPRGRLRRQTKQKQKLRPSLGVFHACESDWLTTYGLASLDQCSPCQSTFVKRLEAWLKCHGEEDEDDDGERGTKKKPIFYVHGATGVGKSVLVKKVAERLQYEVIEMDNLSKKTKNEVLDALFKISSAKPISSDFARPFLLFDDLWTTFVCDALQEFCGKKNTTRPSFLVL